MLIVGYPQRCGGTDAVAPASVELVAAQGAPPRRDGELATGEALARLLPGMNLPAGSAGAVYLLDRPRVTDTVRNGYPHPACRQVVLPLQYTKGRAGASPPAALPRDPPDRSPVRVQAVIDLDGAISNRRIPADPRRWRGPLSAVRGWTAEPVRLNGAPMPTPVSWRSGSGERAQRARRRPRVTIVAFTATVLISVGAMVAADLWWRRDQALALSQARGQRLRRARRIRRASFVSADAALRQLAVHAGRVGGPTASHDAWDPILASARSALRVGSVSSRTGRHDHALDGETIVGASRRDNYVFKQLASIEGDEPSSIARSCRHDAAPVPHPAGTTAADGTGAFDRTAVATVLPGSCREFFRTIDLGPGRIITVFHPDGVVLFREPSAANPINEEATDSLVLQRAHGSSSGTFVGPIQPGGPAFVSAYRTVASPPLLVSVSLPERAVLADWGRQRRVSISAFGALAITLSGLVLLLFRVVTARERAERELADVQRQESDRLRVSNERPADAPEREQRAGREVEEAATKDEFLMTVSHELRTR